MTVPHPLDNPVRSSLAGPHARFAQRRGNVLRYPPDVCPFVALPEVPDAADWADAAELVGPGGLLPLAAVRVAPPAGWAVEMLGDGVQMTGHDVAGAADPEAVPLGPADVPEMLDLAGRTKPGPFLPRTVEMGTYVGIRRGGVLVAMAGERLHPPGWTEISAVCTDAAWRGRGLASRLVLALVAGIRARGEIPFLHAVATNVDAIRLYEELGFRLRQRTVFSATRVPGSGHRGGISPAHAPAAAAAAAEGLPILPIAFEGFLVTVEVKNHRPRRNPRDHHRRGAAAPSRCRP